MTYFGTRLSENISRRDPEGYLICVNVPVARTGVQEYLPSELGLPDPDDRLISVRREAYEVFFSRLHGVLRGHARDGRSSL